MGTHEKQSRTPALDGCDISRERHFNSLARTLGAAEIDLEELRSSLQSETDHQISIWINLARIAALGTFGTEEQMHAAMDQYALLFEPKSDEDPKDATEA
jgi:hypothetical protein